MQAWNHNLLGLRSLLLLLLLQFVNITAGAEPGGTPTAPPSIDQNPPENTTAAPAAVAGATPEYDARGDPISNRGASRPM